MSLVIRRVICRSSDADCLQGSNAAVCHSPQTVAASKISVQSENAASDAIEAPRDVESLTLGHEWPRGIEVDEAGVCGRFESALCCADSTGGALGNDCVYGELDTLRASAEDCC